jgi:hypothetical protein
MSKINSKFTTNYGKNIIGHSILINKIAVVTIIVSLLKSITSERLTNKKLARFETCTKCFQ